MEQITINLLRNNKNFIIQIMQYLSPILGVILGFVLSTYWDTYKSKKDFKDKKEAVWDELKTNMGLIPQKINVLKQMKDALSNESLLPGNSVLFSSHIYHSYISDITSELSKTERENLHVIYERLKIVDLFLNNFFDKYIQEKRSGILNNQNEDYKNTCDDVIKSCLISNHLIESLLEGSPQNIEWEKTSSEKQLNYIKDYLLHHIYMLVKNNKIVTTEQVNKKAVSTLNIKSTFLLLQTLKKEKSIIKLKQNNEKDIAKYKWKFVE